MDGQHQPDHKGQHHHGGTGQGGKQLPPAPRGHDLWIVGGHHTHPAPVIEPTIDGTTV